MIPIKDYAGPRRRLPWVTWGLIAVNVVVFLYQISLGANAQEFIFAYSVVPVALTHGIPQTSLPGVPAHIPFHTPSPVYLTLITAMFLHAGWLHIGGNMLFLYIFGDNVEDRMGHIPYLLFYLFCGALAAGAHLLTDWTSATPTLGASGAIAGVLGAYLIMFPRRRVLTLIFFFIITWVYLPAVVVLGAWFILQLYSGVGSIATNVSAGGGVAYFAHIGGFAFGALMALLFFPKEGFARRPPPTRPDLLRGRWPARRRFRSDEGWPA